MPELKNLVESIEKRIGQIHDESKNKPLHSQEPGSRVKALEKYLDTVREISAEVVMLETAGEAESVRVETKKAEEELGELEKYLKRNLLFEQQKTERQPNALMEQKATPEVYSAIEEKISGASMKLWYLLEKILVELKSKQAMHSTGNGPKGAFELVKAKEQELQEYKSKYNSLLSRGLMSRVAGDTSVDLEESIQGTSRKLEASAAKLHETIANNRKALELLNRTQDESTRKLNALEQLLQSYMSKNLELLTLLKKEKESVQKNFTDMEHETAKLRTMYSKKILDLEEEKADAKKTVQKELEEKMGKLKIQLEQKEQYLEHYKQEVEEKEAQVRKLSEALERAKEKKHKRSAAHHAKHHKRHARHKTKHRHSHKKNRK